MEQELKSFGMWLENWIWKVKENKYEMILYKDRHLLHHLRNPPRDKKSRTRHLRKFTQ